MSRPRFFHDKRSILDTHFVIDLPSGSMVDILGQEDRHLRRLDASVRSNLVVRGDQLHVHGPIEEEQRIRDVLRDMIEMSRTGAVDASGVDAALTLAGFHPGGSGTVKDSSEAVIVYERPGLVVKTRSRNQREYVESAREADLTFAVGPAGTGKTYLAVALAVRSFTADEVDRIILVRPAVEAGETLGFLPGDLKEKVDPYFRPLYDALMDMIPPEKVKRFMDQNRIEVAPLAYMRGRTLSNAFVILDEAQNTTSEQLKMFLTRLGHGSKAIVTGDLTQIDLMDKDRSGLAQALVLLRDIQGIRFVSLESTDVVRHGLVQHIIRAYDRESGNSEMS
ncbi:AAA family ATPase [bacterium]|nr:AAA family ATPase [bacterium]